MIAFFPELYPDELLYSAFARYLDKSGYGTYRAAAEDIFKDSLVKPDILFVNKLDSELITILAKQKPWEKIITEHTMYPYFGRFLPKERKDKAFQSLINMDGHHRNHLQMIKNGNSQKRFLRFCPECCRTDRRQYGEAYWRRIHQMPDIDICPVHGCFLINSEVSLSQKRSPGFFSAEFSADTRKSIACDNPLEMKLAEYVAELFMGGIVDYETPIHQFLHEKMAGGKYTSPRGEAKYMSLLYQDISEYYSDLNDNPIKERWQLEKVCNGRNTHTKNIAMLAMFLGLSPAELLAGEMPQELHQDAFDRRVRELHEQGLKYPRIAEIMNAPLNVVKPVGECRYGIYAKGRGENKGGVKSRDWDQYDKELLPQVKAAIAAIRNDGGRPGRVTYNSVSNYIGIPGKRYLNLTLCRKEIAKNYDCWERYWAREMIYFYQQLQVQGKPISVKAITDMTNAKRSNLKRGLPYLEQYTDAVTASAIRDLIM